MADYQGLPTLTEQVADRIATVNTAYVTLEVDLDGRLWKTAAVKEATQALKDLRPRLNDWADSGTEAARIGEPPHGRPNWEGWVQSGRLLLERIAELAEEGDAPLLPSIIENAKASVVAATKEAPKRIGKAAVKGAVAVAGATGETAAALVQPLTVPLALVVIGIIGIAFIVRGR